MIDIQLVRENKDKIEALLKTKDPSISLSRLFELDQKIRSLKTEGEKLKSERNALSKQIGEMKRKGEDARSPMDQVGHFGDQIQAIDHELAKLTADYTRELASLPNLPKDGIKVASDPKENVITKTWGKKPTFSFKFKNHLELDEKLHLFDFKRGAKISGHGFPVYRAMGARLEWALIQYMIAINVKNGFEQWIPPILVREETVFWSGQLPKFETQQFKIKDDDFNLYLIPTAEVALNGLHADEIFEEEELPKKYVAYTPCFRREAGAAGAQERGLIRTHQFNKVEMFAFTLPQMSDQVFDQMITNAEEILQGLELHYRLAELVTGDMSFAAAKTVDIEVWLPGQDRYYEVSSVSNCTDYQARRSKIRYRQKGEKPEFVHTLNGSGLATSRLLVSILENNQNADGTVNIPKALRPYLNGIEKLSH
jgi:seryl-tRNA synthetase